MKYCARILVLSLMTSCNLSSEKIIEQHENGVPKKVFVYQGGEKIKEITFYANGQKEREYYVIDTTEHGSYASWYENGTLRHEAFFNMGKKDGVSYEYDVNGNRYRGMIYENGKNLVFTTYFPSGSKWTEINGIDDKVYAWYENGQVKAEIANVNGPCIEYYEDGAMKLYGHMRKGVEDSVWRYWNRQGELMKEVFYSQGEAKDSLMY